jgi:hypothetical protein
MLGPLRGPGRVEEPHNHGNQPLGAIHERNMSGAREHSESYIREAGVIAGDAAAEQSKHLDHVLGTDNIRVPSDEQSGRLDRGNGIIRPVHKLPIQLLRFGDEPGPILRIRRGPFVVLLERGSSQVFGMESLHSCEDPWLESVSREDGRGDYQLAHDRWMLDGDTCSNAIAEEVGTLDPDVSEESDGIVGHLLIGERSITVGGVPMGLLLDGDDLPSPRQDPAAPFRTRCRWSTNRREAEPAGSLRHGSRNTS